MNKKQSNFRKFVSQLWDKIDKPDVLSQTEQLAFDIFKISLEDDNNVRFLSSKNLCKKYILTKSYFTDNKVDTFIILNATANKITIVNHQYKYDISIPTKTCGKMDSMFDKKVEEERETMETTILNNISESLDIVLKQFKDNLTNF